MNTSRKLIVLPALAAAAVVGLTNPAAAEALPPLTAVVPEEATDPGVGVGYTEHYTAISTGPCPDDVIGMWQPQAITVHRWVTPEEELVVDYEVYGNNAYDHVAATGTLVLPAGSDGTEIELPAIGGGSEVTETYWSVYLDVPSAGDGADDAGFDAYTSFEALTGIDPAFAGGCVGTSSVVVENDNDNNPIITTRVVVDERDRKADQAGPEAPLVPAPVVDSSPKPAPAAPQDGGGPGLPVAAGAGACGIGGVLVACIRRMLRS